MLVLDQIQTVALAGLVLFVGYGIRRLIPPLSRYNVPAPVVGGLLLAIVITAARWQGWTLFQFATTLQPSFQNAFFTSVGFGASVALLRVGGPAVALFFVLATILAIVQNIVGAGVAMALGQHPLMGVLAGSVTLTGGPATGLAFAPQFEQAGVAGAATIAVAAAMVGIVSGGLVGGPIGTWLIRRIPQAPSPGPSRRHLVAANIVENQIAEAPAAVPEGEDVEAHALLKALVLILVAMWGGAWVSAWFTSMGLTLPAYIGAMLVAALIRNIDDVTGLIGISQRVVDDLGAVALSLFLVMALMTLQLWALVGLALPLAIMLIVQVLMVAVVAAGPVFRLMRYVLARLGADKSEYESAVMAGGFIGFMLGTTANAMANMEALVEQFGPAPKAFLVVPMVGAFFIDFTNAIIITVCLNIWA